MKVIVSPSKTMQFNNIDLDGIKPVFQSKTEEILKRLKSFTKEELGRIYRIKGDLLEKVYSNILDFDHIDENIAIRAYTGLVFKGLEIDSYDQEEWLYLNDTVIILSALYGLLTPNTLIKEYRLDFSCMNDLYSLWKDVGDFINEPIINLASNEYSKMIKKKMINIGFRDFSNGKYKNIPTYSKQARGRMLNYLIKKQIDDVETIKLFSDLDYSYNSELSDEFNLIFTRKK